VLRVLVVDDDVAVCEALADLLRLQHHEVAVAENGAEALLTKPIDFSALRQQIETRLGMVA